MGQQHILEFDDAPAIERNFAGLLRTVPNNQTNYATHGFHYYPATFIPQFPAFFIPYLSQKGELVVDPMCGAGTTLIESALQGRRFWGCDIDPVAALISKVSITPLANCKSEKEFTNKINNLLSQIQKESTPSKLKRIEIPSEDEFPNACLWFREEVLKELILIKNIIHEEKEKGFRDFALLSLSSIVRSVSNADPRDIFPQRDLKNPIRERKNPFQEFENALWQKSEKVVDFSRRIANKKLGKIQCGDAREISLKDNTAQLVFTSSPYAYAIDYARVQQLSTLLLFMKNPKFREYRRKYVGTDRVSLQSNLSSYEGLEFAEDELNKVLESDKKCGLILHQYLKDMHIITKECYRILKPNGYLVYVVGNSTVKKTKFKTNEIFEILCKTVGFKIERILERPYYVYRMSRKRNVQSNTVKSDFFIVAKKVK